jgi:cobaltochelatase CobS subunit
MSEVSAELLAKLREITEKGAPAAPAAKKKAEKVAPAVPKAAIPTGATKFSDVFGYVPSVGDFAVTVLPTNSNPEVARLVPAIDPDYVVQKEEAAYLVAGLEDGDKSLLTGPTGSGKSSLVKYVCAKLNRPFIRINMSGDVESAALFGTLVVEGGATVWRDGAITEAVKYGAVCLVDEWELMPAEIAMGMQNLLEDGGYLYLKEKPGTSADRTCIPHPDFRLVFAGNTVGQGDTTGAFNGVGVQNTATIDRFTNTIRLDYLSATHEVNIITSRTSVPKALAKDMVKMAGLVRSAYDSGKLGLTMSPRTLINWGRKMGRYSQGHAFRVAYMQKLHDDDKKAVAEIYRKVFGEEV